MQSHHQLTIWFSWVTVTEHDTKKRGKLTNARAVGLGMVCGAAKGALLGALKAKGEEVAKRPVQGQKKAPRPAHLAMSVQQIANTFGMAR